MVLPGVSRGSARSGSLFQQTKEQDTSIRALIIASTLGAACAALAAAERERALDARTEPPVILTDPGPKFQDEARPGARVIGMDRTPRGRIWGCWTGTGDKP